ncbi:Uma2 family endonuclease [soil metagenome]
MPMATESIQWTLAELHRLPDDGNKYELVRGELFVTPAPTPLHENVLARLTEILFPYVQLHALGSIYHPRSVLRFEGSEVEPDLMVRQPRPTASGRWEDAPVPILVVEVLSDSTRRRDLRQKRDFYLDAGVAEYWVLDPEARTAHVVRRGMPDLVTDTQLEWLPAGVIKALVINSGRLIAFLPESP